jgi:hypothetical protein
MNEMSALRELRSEVPEPSGEALRVAEARFRAEMRVAVPAPRPVAWRFAWRAGLAAGLAALVAVGVVSIRGGHAPAPPPDAGRSTGPTAAGPLRAVSAAQVLDLAAHAAETSGEIAPKPNQFIVYESITMYQAFVGEQSRYLYRTKRKIWLSADGTRTGALRVEHLDPIAYPGWPIPPEATRAAGSVELLPLCPTTGAPPRDYVHLSTLPTDPDGMLAHLRASAAGGKGDANYRLWTAAGDLLRESYLPPAQRAALYRAIKLIPGVELVDRAEDAAGRTGVAVGFVDTQRGIRDQLIFAPDTYRFLGERAFVVDAAKAQAPVGSQLAGTAELSVTVADSAPAATPGPKGPNC